METRRIRKEGRWKTVGKAVIHTEDKGEITELKEGRTIEILCLRYLYGVQVETKKRQFVLKFLISHSGNCRYHHRCDYLGARVRRDNPGKHVIQ